MIVHDPIPVRDEGTVVVFEGIATVDGELQLVWFAVDHRQAEGVSNADDAVIEEWQLLGRTETIR